jgi:hypothetical protein
LFIDEVDVPRYDVDVHGRCDGICIVDNEFTVVEFKSINRSKVNQPKDEHVGQLTWYMYMWYIFRKSLYHDFGFIDSFHLCEMDILGIRASSGKTLSSLDKIEKMLMFSKNIVGELIYESKQTNETYHFPIKLDIIKAEKVMDWFKKLDAYVKMNKKPDVSYDKTKFPCSWGSGSTKSKCPYYDLCYGD